MGLSREKGLDQRFLIMNLVLATQTLTDRQNDTAFYETGDM